MKYKLSVIFIVMIVIGQVSLVPADTCTKEDFEHRVSGTSQCLVMHRFGIIEPGVMVVWLHGDVSSGGPANYHFTVAEKAAKVLSQNKVLSIALLRPGYPDGRGNTSTVDPLQSGRSDHYTRENILEVGTAIERLRTQYKPRMVIVVGHSGGAATAAVLLGLKPALIDGAVLVGCPCGLAAWRKGRKEWSRSENPSKWVDAVDPATRVIAMTGERDDKAAPELAREYIQVLEVRKINAVFRSLPKESHNSSFESPEVLNAIKELIAAKPLEP